MPTEDGSMDNGELTLEVKALRRDHSDLRTHVDQLKLDMAEIRQWMRHAATKEDVSGLVSQIDRAVNGLLRDALNSIPARQMVWWTIVMAGATILTTLGTLHVLR